MKQKQKEITMKEYSGKMDEIIKNNEGKTVPDTLFEMLNYAGSIKLKKSFQQK
mgnify:CR=1 FL=1